VDQINYFLFVHRLESRASDYLFFAFAVRFEIPLRSRHTGMLLVA